MAEQKDEAAEKRQELLRDCLTELGDLVEFIVSSEVFRAE